MDIRKSVSTTNLVPYTGAKKDVNIGTHDIVNNWFGSLENTLIVFAGQKKEIQVRENDVLANDLSAYNLSGITVVVKPGVTVNHTCDFIANFCYDVQRGGLINVGAKSPISGESLATGNGSAVSFSGILSDPPIKYDSLVVHYTISGTAYSATSNGGVISGTDCSGTINSSDGTWSLFFTTAPDDGTAITGDYTPVFQLTLNSFNATKKSWKIFGGDGDIKFGRGAVSRIYPEWWQDNTIPGTTDMTLALRAAGRQDYVEKLTLTDIYKITNRVKINEQIVEGPATIDASGADLDSWAKEVDGCRYMVLMEGQGLIALPALSANVSHNDLSLSFSTTPNVLPNDVIVLYNPTDYSYSGFRSYYRAGEYLKVKDISGTTVNLQAGVIADYIAGDINAYKLERKEIIAKDLTIIGIGNSSGYEKALKIKYATKVTLNNVKVNNFSYDGISLQQCYNVDLKSCEAESEIQNPAGNIYPLSIDNSQKVKVSDGYYNSWWHGITTGGGDYVGCVPNREIILSGVFLSNSTGTIQAFGPHGNTEYCMVSNCIINGGLVFGGNHSEFSNSILIGPKGNGAALRGSELSGLDHVLKNNFVYSNYPGTSTGWSGIFSIGGNNTDLSSNTGHGGTVKFNNNTLIWDVPNGTTIYFPISLRNRGYAGSDPINIEIKNNTLSMIDPTIPHKDLSIDVVSGNNWDNVVIEDNTIDCGIYAKNISNAKINFNKSTISTYGIYAKEITNSIAVISNEVYKSDYTPLYINGTTTKAKLATIKNNKCKDCNKVSGSTAQNSGVFVSHFKNVHVLDNFGETNEPNLSYHIWANDINKLILRDNDIQGAGVPYYFTSVLASNFDTDFPHSQFWQRGDRCNNRLPSASGVPGWVCVSRVDTTMRVAGAANDTSLEVTSTSAMAAGDIIGVSLDNGTIHWTTISSITDSDTLVITDGLPSASSDGNKIYTNRWEALGNGDVSGPLSSANAHVAFFDGTTGKLIKDSGLTLSGVNTGDQDLSGLEPSLGNPSTDDYVLSSKTDGTRSWVAPGGGSGDVLGPSSNTDGYIPVWNGANSKTLADGIANNSAHWNTAYDERRQWDGGNTNLNAATGRSSLGLGSAATCNAEDTLTDGSNLPDGHAIKTYGDNNWNNSGGYNNFTYIFYKSGDTYYAKANILSGLDDYSGSECHTVLQNVINALGSLDQRGNIYCIEGTYSLTGQVTGDHGIAIVGCGGMPWGSYGTHFNLDADVDVFKYTSKNCFGFQHIAFNGNNRNNKILWFYGTGSSGDDACSNILIQDCSFYQCRQAVYGNYAYDIWLRDTNFIDCGYQTTYDACHADEGCNTWHFGGCRWESLMGRAFRSIKGSTNNEAFCFTDCKFHGWDSNKYSGIYGDLFQSRIADCFFYDTGNSSFGIYLSNSSNIIANNNFLGHDGYAIRLDSGYNVVEGNIFTTDSSVTHIDDNGNENRFLGNRKGESDGNSLIDSGDASNEATLFNEGVANSG